MFERLTYRDPGEFGLARIRANHFNRCNAGTKYESITGFAPERLAAYEDTGLTPDEIAALRAELAAMGAENDMLKDTMIRACVWLDVHGRPGIPDVTRTLSEAVAATVKKEAHNEPRT